MLEYTLLLVNTLVYHFTVVYSLIGWVWLCVLPTVAIFSSHYQCLKVFNSGLGWCYSHAIVGNIFRHVWVLEDKVFPEFVV